MFIQDQLVLTIIISLAYSMWLYFRPMLILTHTFKKVCYSSNTRASWQYKIVHSNYTHTSARPYKKASRNWHHLIVRCFTLDSRGVGRQYFQWPHSHHRGVRFTIVLVVFYLLKVLVLSADSLATLQDADSRSLGRRLSNDHILLILQ